MSHYVLRRFGLLIVQLWAISTLVFLLVQILPGDPLYSIVGPEAGRKEIAETRHYLGLDKPLQERYLQYYSNVLRGDLGTSFFNSTPVGEEIWRRFPATVEILVFSLTLSILIGISIGTISAIRPSGFVERATFFYGMVAGALPEFWWALVLILVFFNYAGIVAAPVGRLDLAVSEPQHLTGLLVVDSILTGNWEALRSSLQHLFLPVATLVFLNTGAILKMTRFQMQAVLQSSFIRYAQACGLRERTILWYAFKNCLPAVMTQCALFWASLIGGLMLIETIFSWGGIGQYVVQAVVTADFLAATGGVLALTTWSLIVYLILDVMLAYVDPRVRY